MDSNKVCNKCHNEIKDQEPVYCGICVIDQMWQIQKLEKVKMMIDEIIKLSKVDEKANPYSEKDYAHLF